MNRGAVVIVDFSATSPAEGIRPALVVQNDTDNARMQNTITTQITGNVSRVHEATQLLIAPSLTGVHLGYDALLR